ncbi:hypothetical protein GOBAR_DD24282 [Gossypium barbadense]|nr:hypothetical protein GOBAR_DD24282 [Gossypium barbadense]
MNGLVTDRQMFALKSLRIPLTGRHPPSPCSTNGSDTLRQSSANKTPAQHLPPELFDSFQSLRLKTSPRILSPTMSSLQDIMSAVEAKDGGPDQANEKLVRRRQKSEADLTARTPERLLKEDSTNGGGYSTIIAKGLALRTKAVNRTKSGADAEFAGFNPMPTGLGDGFVVAGFSTVRKSSSTKIKTVAAAVCHHCGQLHPNGVLSLICKEFQR